MKPPAIPASPPLVFLHGIGGAARAWRGQLDCFRRPLSRHRLGHAGLWRLGAACQPSASPALPTRLQDFLQQVGATKPVIVGHSIGGMIVQQLLANNPAHRRAPSCWRRPARRSASPMATGRSNSSTRGSARSIAAKRMVSLAPSLVKELVGDDPDAARHGAGARLHGRGSRGELSRHHAGADGVRSAQRAEEYRGADAGAVGLEGQERAGADDGEDGELYSRRRPMSNSKASAISPIWNAPTTFNAALDRFPQGECDCNTK